MLYLKTDIMHFTTETFGITLYNWVSASVGFMNDICKIVPSFFPDYYVNPLYFTLLVLVKKYIIN